MDSFTEAFLLSMIATLCLIYLWKIDRKFAIFLMFSLLIVMIIPFGMSSSRNEQQNTMKQEIKNTILVYENTKFDDIIDNESTKVEVITSPDNNHKIVIDKLKGFKFYIINKTGESKIYGGEYFNYLTLNYQSLNLPEILDTP